MAKIVKLLNNFNALPKKKGVFLGLMEGIRVSEMLPGRILTEDKITGSIRCGRLRPGRGVGEQEFIS
jgi:hypothetical protein